MTYKMTEEQLKLLLQIFNTLSLIKTNGQDTIYMGQCLASLEVLINQISNTDDSASDQE